MKITETNLQFKNALTKRSKTEKIVTHHAAAKVCDAKTIHGMDSVVGNMFDDTFRTIWDCHLNSIGYMYFAKFIKDKILDYANKNPKEYNVNYPNYHN